MAAFEVTVNLDPSKFSLQAQQPFQKEFQLIESSLLNNFNSVLSSGNLIVSVKNEQINNPPAFLKSFNKAHSPPMKRQMSSPLKSSQPVKRAFPVKQNSSSDGIGSGDAPQGQQQDVSTMYAECNLNGERLVSIPGLLQMPYNDLFSNLSIEHESPGPLAIVNNNHI